MALDRELKLTLTHGWHRPAVPESVPGFQLGDVALNALPKLSGRIDAGVYSPVRHYQPGVLFFEETEEVLLSALLQKEHVRVQEPRSILGRSPHHLGEVLDGVGDAWHNRRQQDPSVHACRDELLHGLESLFGWRCPRLQPAAEGLIQCADAEADRATSALRQLGKLVDIPDHEGALGDQGNGVAFAVPAIQA